MAKDKVNNSQSQEDLIKSAQEAAVKAAMEQVQSMFGNIPGFEMPEMGDMQSQTMSQMQAAVPGVDQLQAKQAAMGTLGGADATAMGQTCSQNMAYAQQMMKETIDGTLAGKLAGVDAVIGQMTEDADACLFDTDWEINRSGDEKLNEKQLYLLAFGAPLLVYNDENVDTIDSEVEVDGIKSTLESWWNITDRASTLEIIEWLLNEGHHAEADEALATLHEKGLKNIPEKELADEDSKMGDVCLIIESMLENEYCTEQNIPQTAIAWDLVRVINVGRWAYLCSYIMEDEMWQIMQLTVNTAMQQFSSWKEYGLSFVLGRGVWHGDSDDSETAHEIVSTLLEREESPWKQFMWNNTYNK